MSNIEIPKAPNEKKLVKIFELPPDAGNHPEIQEIIGQVENEISPVGQNIVNFPTKGVKVKINCPGSRSPDIAIILNSLKGSN